MILNYPMNKIVELATDRCAWGIFFSGVYHFHARVCWDVSEIFVQIGS